MRKILIFAWGGARRYDFHGVRVKGSALLRRFIVGIAIVAALTSSDAFAGGYGRGGGHRHIVRGGVVYVPPYVAYPYAYPYPPYAYPGSYLPPGYIPENFTYCDPNSGTYIDIDGARRLC